MKVLLDECCPKPLTTLIAGAEVFTVEMAGLKGYKNGAPIAAAEGVYDVFITADKNLRYQQNLANRRITIIELPFNSWKRVRTLAPVIQATLTTIQPGQYLEIPATPTVI